MQRQANGLGSRSGGEAAPGGRQSVRRSSNRSVGKHVAASELVLVAGASRVGLE